MSFLAGQCYGIRGSRVNQASASPPALGWRGVFSPLPTATSHHHCYQNAILRSFSSLISAARPSGGITFVSWAVRTGLYSCIVLLRYRNLRCTVRETTCAAEPLRVHQPPIGISRLLRGWTTSQTQAGRVRGLAGLKNLNFRHCRVRHVDIFSRARVLDHELLLPARARIFRRGV